MHPEHFVILQTILQEHVPERTVWLFGSRATDHARPTSDADLAILGDVPLPLLQYAHLRAAFEESSLPFRVDIVDWASTSPEFRSVIERAHLILQEAAP